MVSSTGQAGANTETDAGVPQIEVTPETLHELKIAPEVIKPAMNWLQDQLVLQGVVLSEAGLEILVCGVLQACLEKLQISATFLPGMLLAPDEET